MIQVRLNKDSGCYPYSNWISGKFEYRHRIYEFNAKIFTDCSDFSINEGHISKLAVAAGDRLIVYYDRGHEIGDSRMYERGMVKELVDYLDEYAKSHQLIY